MLAVVFALLAAYFSGWPRDRILQVQPIVLAHLISLMVIFLGAIVVAGVAAREPINQAGAAALLLQGLLLAILAANALGLSPLVGHRVRQLLTALLCLGISVQYRLPFLAAGKPLPRGLKDTVAPCLGLVGCHFFDGGSGGKLAFNCLGSVVRNCSCTAELWFLVSVRSGFGLCTDAARHNFGRGGRDFATAHQCPAQAGRIGAYGIF